MEQLELIFKAIRNIVLNFVLTGILAIIIGVLIFIYPNFLSILAGLFFLIIGASSLIAAVKVNKYSKIKIKL